jgi:hypothetical protein
MPRISAIPVCCLCLLCLPALTVAQDAATKERIAQEREKSRQTEQQLESARGVVRLLLQIAQQQAKGKPDDEEKIKLAQNVLEVCFGVARQVNRARLESKVKTLQTEATAREQAETQQHKQQEDRRQKELQQLHEDFAGILDVYLEPGTVEVDKPTLHNVVFDGVVVVSGKKLLRFRPHLPAETSGTWLIDPARLVAVYRCKAPSVSANTQSPSPPQRGKSGTTNP